jgi:hypothetical protein
MDLETLRLILPVAGTLFGVVLGGFSAYHVALASIRGQREIAHDNAKREQRLRQVAPFLERAKPPPGALATHGGGLHAY